MKERKKGEEGEGDEEGSQKSSISLILFLSLPSSFLSLSLPNTLVVGSLFAYSSAMALPKPLLPPVMTTHCCFKKEGRAGGEEERERERKREREAEREWRRERRQTIGHTMATAAAWETAVYHAIERERERKRERERDVRLRESSGPVLPLQSDGLFLFVVPIRGLTKTLRVCLQKSKTPLYLPLKFESKN
jgi:hypothetical protein